MSGSSLIPFHRVLISAGILFCAGFGVWTWFAAADSDGVGLWILGGIFVALALVLAVYLWNLDRILGIGDGRPGRGG